MEKSNDNRCYFVKSLCDGGIFIPPDKIKNGDEVDIIDLEETFFGLQAVVRCGNENLSIPMECIVKESGNIYIAMVDKKVILNQENEIFLMKVSKTRTTSKRVVVCPVLEFTVTDRVKVVICKNGDSYFLLDKRVQTYPLGYVGKAFEGKPVNGKRFMFKSLIPFPLANNRTRWYYSWITINHVDFYEKIGKKFYRVIGNTTNKVGRTFQITAYVTL